MGLLDLFSSGSDGHFRGPDRAQLARIEAKLDLILKHMHIDFVDEAPSALPPQVRAIARDPSRKIEAIKAYREHTGAGLKEAKDAVEAFIRTGR